MAGYMNMRAAYKFYENLDSDATYNPVGVMLDETEEDILEEVRFDINFKQGDEW